MEFSKGTVPGAGFSVAGVIIMLFLFMMEFQSFMKTTYKMDVILDENPEESLQINFNLTVPRLPCHLATIDVTNVMGTHRVNITKNIWKWQVLEDPITLDLRRGEQFAGEGDAVHFEEYDENVHNAHRRTEGAKLLNIHTFRDYIEMHDLVMVNFYAPWCYFSALLAPVYDHTAAVIRDEKPYKHLASLAKVNCASWESRLLCARVHITGFPTILVYRKGQFHTHEAYRGHRSVQGLLTYVESALDKTHPTWRHFRQDTFAELKAGIVQAVEPGAGSSVDGGEQDPAATQVADMLKNDEDASDATMKEREGAKAWEGCNIAGFLMVQKVPGNFHVTTHQPGMVSDHNTVNVSHFLHHLSFGRRLEPSYALKELQLKQSKPAVERFYGATERNTMHDHYVKVVLNDYHLLNGESLTTYKYTMNSHQYIDHHHVPEARFTYDISPMSIVNTQESKPFYHFLTSVCAILGGMFTMVGLCDSFVYYTTNSMTEKFNLGKHG